MPNIINESNVYNYKDKLKYPEQGIDNISCKINTNEFLFYSNNPESIDYEHLTENGKWLCRETVKGNGQIYTWHRNEYEGTITSLI